MVLKTMLQCKRIVCTVLSFSEDRGLGGKYRAVILHTGTTRDSLCHNTTGIKILKKKFKRVLTVQF